jgi:hypothetical protein
MLLSTIPCEFIVADKPKHKRLNIEEVRRQLPRQREKFIAVLLHGTSCRSLVLMLFAYAVLNDDLT